MDAVRVNGPGPQQTKLFIHAQVAACCGVKLFDPGDFIKVFCHMGLNPHIRVLGCQLTCTAQLRSAAGRHKTRRDGVTEAVHAVPLLDQGFGIDQALFGVVAQPVRCVLVHQHLACHHAQLVLLRLAQQGIDRLRM